MATIKTLLKKQFYFNYVEGKHLKKNKKSTKDAASPGFKPGKNTTVHQTQNNTKPTRVFRHPNS